MATTKPHPITQRVARIITSVCGAGFMPVAPGLAGSVVGLAIAYPLRMMPLAQWAVLAALCVSALWAIPITERQLGSDDPPSIVIDETVGMLLALCLVPWYPPAVCVGLMLFRVLDVWKLPPIRRLEWLRSPYGVLADDIACGVIVNVVLQGWVRGVVLSSGV
jgi:phosphatidylglycerophosphatase A